MAWSEAARKAALEARRRKRQWKGLHTDDYQGRKGGYPRSGMPTDIRVHKSTAQFAFKNTQQNVAEAWVRRHLQERGLSPKILKSRQAGDYYDDWVEVDVKRDRFTGPRRQRGIGYDKSFNKGPGPLMQKQNLPGADQKKLVEAAKRKARRQARKLRAGG